MKVGRGGAESLRPWNAQGSRSRPRPTWCGWFAAALALATGTSAAATNYLVMIADDLGVDKVASYAGDYPGYAPTYLPMTPALDSLAAAGLRFSRAWASPLCSPTRASFQTGQQPFRTGIGAPSAIEDDPAGLRIADFTMLAQSFKDAGYATGFFGKWHIGQENEIGDTTIPAADFCDAPHPVVAGWDRFFGRIDGEIGNYKDWTSIDWVSGLCNVPGATGTSGTGLVTTETQHATTRTAAAARDWITTQPADAPWLAVIAFHAPHSRSLDAGDNWNASDTDPTRVRSATLTCLDPVNNTPCTDADRQAYQGLVEHMDLEIEDLLNTIGTTNPAVLDDTVIIFFGDNGTPNPVQEGEFLAPDIVPPPPAPLPSRGKGTSYENGVRVPLIIADGAAWRTPGAGRFIKHPGRRVDLVAHVLDLYQTLHHHGLGYQVDATTTHSRSLVTCFKKGNAKRKTYCGQKKNLLGYAESFKLDASGAPDSADVAVRRGNDKMVATYDGTCLKERFFNTAIDPFEKTPLPASGPRAERLRCAFLAVHETDPTSWATGLGFCSGPIGCN